MIAGEKVEPNTLSDLTKMNSTLSEQLFNPNLVRKKTVNIETLNAIIVLLFQSRLH